jgi:hypothetical protein
MQLLDLYATSTNSEVPYTAQTGSGCGAGIPPYVLAGRAYIGGHYAPDGTVVTAWIGGEEIIEFRTTVVNNPTPLAEPKLLSILQTEIPPPSPLPTPCPGYIDCKQTYYGGRLADEIKSIMRFDNVLLTWWFYSPDPVWELAHNLPPDMCNYVVTDNIYARFYMPFRVMDSCSFGGNHVFGNHYNMKRDVLIRTSTLGTNRDDVIEFGEGWNPAIDWLSWDVSE